MRLIRKYLVRHAHMLAFGLLMLLVCSGTQLFLPKILRGVFNDLQRCVEGVGAGDVAPSTFLIAGIKFAGLTLLVALARMAWRRIIWPRARLIEYEIRSEIFAHMRGLPPDFFHSSASGDLLSRATSDLDAVRRFYAMGLLCFTDALLLIPASFFLMMKMDVPMTLVAAGPLLLGSPFSMLLMKKLHATYAASQDALGTLTGRVQEDIAGVRAIKTYAREEAAFSNFEKQNTGYADKAVRVARFDALFEPYFRLLPEVSLSVVLAWGGVKVIAGSLKLGDLVAFTYYVGLMIWPTFAAGMGLNILQRARASAKRLEEIFSVKPSDKPPDGAGPDAFRGDFAIENLSFTHKGRSDPALRGVTLRVPSGEVLGVTGPTGSGKSTLLNLAAGLLTPPSGTVFLDGTDTGGIGRPKLRRTVTLVEQTPFMFSRSLEENLAYGREDSSRDHVIDAVHMAALEGDVASFEQGLSTAVGERGVTLSGGQKLRAALARALLVRPKVLLLDDVFSAVDVETERKIWSRIKPRLKGTTVIIVSHRTSVLRRCDKVAVLTDGALAEYGTHGELIAAEGFYAKSFALQERFES